MISAMHDATVVNTGRKDRKTNMEIKKPYAVVQYNKFMNGIDRADHYLSSEENCKMVEKGGTVSAKVCAPQRIFCAQDTKYKQESKVQELPARGRKVLDIRSPESK
jgi:hypothetical protein